MHRFWNRAINPVLETVAPERVLEIGAEAGWNTEKLLEYCRANGARLDVVDPVAHPNLQYVLGRFPAEVTYHAKKSLAALPTLQPAQLVLLDGDHNWFTVYNELQLIYLRAAGAGVPPPVILLHDVAWPYARRDMYYDPAGLDFENRHPYAYRGVLPDQSDLSDFGLNGRLANAMHEGGPRNGVLTAVEDFRASLDIKTSLHLLPFFNGLGILVPETRMTPALQEVIRGLFSSDSLLETCMLLEKDAMSVRAELVATKITLANRGDALARAADHLAARSTWTRWLKSRIKRAFL